VFVNSPASIETFSTPTMAVEEDNLNVMSSEATKNVDDRIQETAFNDAAVVSNAESTAPESRIDRFDELSSIIAFLKRPTLIWQSRLDSSSPSLQPVSTVTTNDIIQTPIKTFTFPYDLMVTGNKFEKIRNFEWFKADVRLRILVNANPFIAGRLWITYSPIDVSSNTATLRTYARIEHKGRVGVTSYPGVELDLQTNTAAELVVPWIAETDAERASLDQQKLYRVDVWMLTPLLVADNALKIPIQVYASFDNIQLKFPTPISYPATPTYRKAYLQAKKEAKGPIEEVASGVSKVSGMLKNVPMLAEYAAPVEWASNIVGKVASIFGWSRPIDGSHATALAHIPGRGMTHFKAKDSGVVLGMCNDNMIAEEEQNFVSTVDEMEISHICSRPGLVDVIDWSTSADYNTVLGQYSASRDVQVPNIKSVNLNTPEVPNVVSVTDHCLSEFVLQNFSMYRADWTYRISLVKTAFHVGRFEVFFVPNQRDLSATDLAALDTTNCYRQIFDITEQSEMSFEIPYVHKYLMMSNQIVDLRATDVFKQPTTGTLVIRVVSPLSCPDTVSQSIKILIWKFATNPAVAFPQPRRHLPLNEIPTGPRTFRSAQLQINVTNEPKGTMYRVFDDENQLEDNLSATKTVAGEMCTNLREATRAYRVHKTGLYYIDAEAKTAVCPNVIDFRTGGYLSVCSYIYYFYRGGIGFKIVDKLGSGIISHLATFNLRNLQEDFSDSPFHITPSNNPIHEISVPFYSQTRRQVCSKLITDPQGAVLFGSNVDIELPYVRVRKIDETELAENSTTLYAAGKDDLTFGFLIGPPLCGNYNPPPPP
jgi:hypothetical protein